jgi:hypothetical protein
LRPAYSHFPPIWRAPSRLLAGRREQGHAARPNAGTRQQPVRARRIGVAGARREARDCGLAPGSDGLSRHAADFPLPRLAPEESAGCLRAATAASSSDALCALPPPRRLLGL